jgi:hypothetical protein
MPTTEAPSRTQNSRPDQGGVAAPPWALSAHLSSSFWAGRWVPSPTGAARRRVADT